MLSNDHLRSMLLQQRNAIFKRVVSAEEDLRWLDDHVAIESQEEGQEENIARLLARLDDQGRAEIDAIDAALIRLANGDYGRCEECGTSIPDDRLHAMPTATKCIDCAKREELNTRR